MTKYTCTNCGTESAYLPSMKSCPNCQSDIDGKFLSTIQAAEDAPEISASIDTAIGGATLNLSKEGNNDGENEEWLGTASDRTMMAADLGYVDRPIHMKTLDTPEGAYQSAGRASSIPHRTVADSEATNGELRDYKLVDKLGSGSFGVVYRAVQVPLDRSVAIKILKPLPIPPSTEGDQSKDSREQIEERIKEEFLREAQFTGKLEHPNIVPIHDIGLVTGGEQSERPFYVMKEIKGISWQDVLSEKTRDENIDIFGRVVDAIGFAHSRNILHCDLKPENVMLGEFGEVLVVDWGQSIDMTDPETFRPGGTPAYCSPEMATYWCNYAANPSKAEAAKREIGPRSDVYLLGSMLFQIVTGRPPHFGLKNETPADVMRRASFNEIRRYDNFLKDELLQIALCTMRVEDVGEEIVTVKQLQDAMKAYESRKQSIELRDRAFELLEEAKATSDYDTYQKAKFGFEESLELWHENPTAQNGLQQTRLSCATKCLADQNFDLGLDMLSVTSTKEEIDTKQQLEVGKKKRDRRKGLVRFLALAVVFAVLAGLAVNSYYVNRNLKLAKEASELAKIAEDKTEVAKLAVEDLNEKNKEAIKLQATVETNKQEIEKQKNLLTSAVDERKTALEQKKAAEDAKKAALDAQQAALDAKKTADEAAAAANDRLGEANVKLGEANIKMKEASDSIASLEEGSKLLRYKSNIAAIAQKADAGDYRGARELLDQIVIDDPNSKSNFDWTRLNLLAHPEVTSNSLYPDQELLGAVFSNDRNRIALCYEDKVEICQADNLMQVIQTFPVSNVKALALSTAGDKIAMGSNGQIEIFDVETKALVATIDKAQSDFISDLEFSYDDKQLLSVGQPDIREVSRYKQNELMVWKDNNGTWEQLENPRFFGRPAKPVYASFSRNGNRIVTSNPNATDAEQVAYVLELTNQNAQAGQGGDNTRDYYKWLKPAGDLKRGFVTSVFGDDAGSIVISSLIENSESGPINQIAVWNVEQNQQAQTGNQPQFVSVSTRNENAFYPTFEPGQTVQVNSRINNLDFQADILIAAGEDQKVLYWNLPNGDLNQLQQLTPKEYGGHSQPIAFSRVLNAGSKFVSVSLGPNPEILLTNVNQFVAANESLKLVESQLGDQSSPFSIFESPESQRMVVGNDRGLASIGILNPQAGINAALKWQVAAWENHFVTDKYLFAKSTRDNFYKYDLGSGALVSILTGLSKVNQDSALKDLSIDQIRELRIFSVVISDNGEVAVVQRSNNKSEFEIWNLATQTSKTVSFGELTGFSAGSDGDDAVLELPKLAISSDGKWIVGGEVRFYLWDATTGQNLGSDFDAKQQVKNLISTLKFVPGTSQLIVGQEGRLRRYDVSKGLGQYDNFPQISNFPAPVNQDNVVAVRNVGDQTLAILRKTFSKDGGIRESGLELVQLNTASKSIEPLAELSGFISGNFESDAEILAVSRYEEKPLVRHNFVTNETVVLTTTATNIQAEGERVPDIKYFNEVFLGENGEIIVQWNLRNQLDPAKRDYYSMAFDRDGTQESNLKVIANPTIKATGIAGNSVVTFDNGRIRKWQISANGTSIQPDGVIPGKFDLFEMSPQGSLAVAIENGTQSVSVIDILTNEIKATVAPEQGARISAAAWADDSSKLAIGFSTGAIQVWEAVDNTVSPITLVKPMAAAEISKLAYSADGLTLLAIQKGTDRAGIANILRLANDKWINVVLQQGGNDSIMTGDVSANGNRVVTGSSRGLVTLWNAVSDVGTIGEAKSEEQRELLTIYKYQSPVREIHFQAGDQAVIAFETNSATNSGLVFKTNSQ